ncbi:hypothetical protein [Cellulomonas sp. ATA003]|uniref:hypothetical protein n=1 Tax=Cellulomonas sp. ATA003 TaxID=3073064 RepID=UPI002872DFF3|nr:hypothetical protein [Cellulomonas sp. ATA003]WNB86516.1 hypothetical protein REH70_04580 [Cellulomonas sp. ATA003]
MVRGERPARPDPRVLRAGEALEGIEGVGAEVDVRVVRRPADTVRADAEEHGEVPARVHEVRDLVERLDVPAAQEVAGLVRHHVAERGPHEPEPVAPRPQEGVEGCGLVRWGGQDVEEHERGLGRLEVAGVDGLRDADGRDAGLGDRAADDDAAHVRASAEPVGVVAAVEHADPHAGPREVALEVLRHGRDDPVDQRVLLPRRDAPRRDEARERGELPDARPAPDAGVDPRAVEVEEQRLPGPGARARAVDLEGEGVVARRALRGDVVQALGLGDVVDHGVAAPGER